MNFKTLAIFILLFTFALGMNIFSRYRHFRASLGPLGDGSIKDSEITYLFENNSMTVPEYVFEDNATNVLGEVLEEKWIEVDLSEQKLTAWQGDSVFLTSLVSTGLTWWPTPTGEFRIWIKLRATRMEGGIGKYYYNLPNVPYTMFFENEKVPGWRGFGLHGTYWHDDFGKPHSHGCVNLPTAVAKELFYWVEPSLKESKWSAKSSKENLGTKIVIHE